MQGSGTGSKRIFRSTLKQNSAIVSARNAWKNCILILMMEIACRIHSEDIRLRSESGYET